MRCQVCNTRMYEERVEHPTHVSIRWHCPMRHAHGEMTGMPMQWRGPNAVATMRRLKTQGHGYYAGEIAGVAQWRDYPV